MNGPAATPLRVAVVGGGIAGVAAAERLAERGHTPVVFDASERLGGRIAPEALGGREIALGGKNIGRRYSELRALLARHGHDRFEYFGPDAGQVVRGRVRQLSFRSPSVRARLGARIALRFEAAGGIRFLRMARRVRREERSRFLGDPWFAELAHATGDPTLNRYLGTALSDVLRFITVRMNAAEPDEAHVGNFGSNLALVVDKFDQLAGPGFAPLLRDFATRHSVQLGTVIDGLVVRAGRVAGVTAGGEELDGFDAVVLAVPAPQAAAIVAGHDQELAQLLRTINYFPVGVVVAKYDRAVFGERFAGIAAPPGMALSNAGAYGLGDRDVVRFTFSGRAARERVGTTDFDPEALLAEGEAFLARYGSLAGTRRIAWTARSFDPGLCAYRSDHAGFLESLEARIAGLDGLLLAGDYLRGASLEACVRSGLECVERLPRERRTAGTAMKAAGT